MIKIQVRYFLNEEGEKFFPGWFERVLDGSSKQDGFVQMMCRFEQNNIVVVHLDFLNQATLNQWKETELHASLSSQIEPYLSKPKEVSVSFETLSL